MSKHDAILSTVARNLSKNAFLKRQKKSFEMYDEMWCWIESVDIRKRREIAIVSETDTIRGMSESGTDHIYVMMKGTYENFQTRSFDSLGWSRETDRISTADMSCLWTFESSTYPLILYEDILQDTKRLRSILENDMQDIIEIEVMMVEKSQHDKIKNESHMKPDELKTTGIPTNRKIEAMTFEGFLARALVNKLYVAYSEGNKVVLKDGVRIARAYEERIFRLNELWNKLSKSIEHRRALEVHERLIVSNAPERFLLHYNNGSSKDERDGWILEMFLTIPLCQYSSKKQTSAMKLWKGRYEWLESKAREILLGEERKEEHDKAVQISQKRNRRRKKKIRMKEEYRKKTMLRIVDDVLNEVVKRALDICARNERRRRKLALRQKQQVILRQKRLYLEMRSITMCMVRAAERICDRRVSKVECARAARVARLAYESASSRVRSACLDVKKLREESSKTISSSSKRRDSRTWASGKCNSLYEWTRDQKGLRAVGTALRGKEEVEEQNIYDRNKTSSKTTTTIRNRRSRRDVKISHHSNLEDTTDPLSSITWHLHRDILDITAAFDRIAKQRRPFQLAVVNAVRAVVNRLWPAARVEVFGSFGQGLSIPASDVDLVVCDVHEHIEQVLLQSDRQASCVQVLAELLREQDWVRNVQTLETAKVPIIKAKTFFEELGAGGVALDISFDMPAHRGLATCAFVRNLRASYPALVPLTLILNPLESLIKDKHITNLPSEIIDKHKIIHRNTKRLKRLIDELMDFRKMQFSELKVQIQKVDLVKIMTNITSNFIEEANFRKIDFQIDFEESIPNQIMVDTSMFDKILFNLLSNAFKATSENGKIRVKASYHNHHSLLPTYNVILYLVCTQHVSVCVISIFPISLLNIPNI